MKNEIRKGAILGYIDMLLNVAIALFYVPFILIQIGQSEYGLYSLITSVIAYLSVLDMGFGNAMIRFVSRSQVKKDNSESVINGMFLFIYIILGFIALIIGSILLFNVNNLFSNTLNSNELYKAKILMGIMVFNVAVSFPLSVFDSYIVANEKYIFSKLYAIIRTVLKPLITIPFVLLGFKSIAMTVILVLINIFSHLSAIYYCFKKLKMKINYNIKIFDKSLLKEIIIYSFFIFLNIIVDNIYNNTDQIILGIVSGTVAVSIYAVASQIVKMNTQASTVISGLFLPKISKMLDEKESDKKISDLFIRVSKIQMYIMMLILFGFLIYGKYFIKIWAGKEYYKAFYIILILIIPSIVPLTQNIAISVIQAKNQHKFRSVLYIIIAILNIFISIPLAKKYQGIGAAIGTAIANILGQIIIMNIFYYKKSKLNIPLYWKNFTRLFIQYSLLAIINIYIINKIGMNLVVMILGSIIFTLCYLIITYFNMDSEEKKEFNRFIKKIKLKVIKI